MLIDSLIDYLIGFNIYQSVEDYFMAGEPRTFCVHIYIFCVIS